MSTQSTLGQLFSDGLVYNPAIFDAKSIVVMPGSYITSIPQNIEYAAARALDSTGGLRKDEMYYRNAERNQLIPVHWAHRHQTGEHWNGGSFLSILLANEILFHKRMLAATPSEWYTGVSGSGVVDISSGNTRVRTGLTQNSWARIFSGGMNVSLSNPVFWRAILRVNDDLAQLVRFGFNMEDPANNADNNEKFGLEGCDGDGPNYRLVTADGINRHKEPTPLPIEQSNDKGYALYLEPGTTITLQYTDGTEIAESNNIPSTGSSDDSSVLKLGIKTTNSNEKQIVIQSAECIGVSGDVDWFQMNLTA